MQKNRWLSKLRQARASELIAGGIWYLRNDDGTFSTVINEITENKQYMQNFREWLKQMSIELRIYVRLDKANYPLTLDAEICTEQRIEKYDKQGIRR